MKKKLISLLLVVVMMVNMLPMTAVASVTEEDYWDIDSGYCGENGGKNLRWVVSENGKLTISGSGKMENYSRVGADGSTAPWYAYNKYIEKIVVKDTVTSIGDWAFAGTKAESVIIGSGVTSIGVGAFFQAKNLTTVSMPDSITFIGNSAFAGNTALSKVVFGAGLTEIDYSAFEFSDNLEEVYFVGNAPDVKPDSSFPSDGDFTIYYTPGTTGWTDSEHYNAEAGTWMGYKLLNLEGAAPVAAGYCGADEGGKNLSWILTDDGTLTISGCGEMVNYRSGKVPWYGYRSSIEAVIICDGVTYIGNYAFSSCSSLTAVTIPDSMTSIGIDAFSVCSSLTSVTIPDGVTSIGDYAFYYCSSLTSVTIPDSVTSIGVAAFACCKGLADQNGMVIVGNVLFGYYGTGGNVVIPDGVTSIGNDAFSFCSRLTSVTLPASLTSIGDYAFYECYSLTAVTIPDSVTSIGNYAFERCSSLAAVYFEGNAPSAGYKAFYDRPVTLYYIPGTNGWGDGDTWNGYKLAVWEGREPVNQDTEKPRITAEEVGGAFGGAEETVSIAVTATDDVAVASVKVEYACSGGEKQLLQTWEAETASETFSCAMDWNVGQLPEGDYELFATAEDTSGNTDTCSFGSFTVDRTAPTIIDVWPKDQVTLCHHTTLQILAEDNHLLKKAEVSYGMAGGETYTAETELTDGKKETKFDIPVDLARLPGGTYEICYKIYDMAGNTAETAASVVVHPYEVPQKPVVTAKAGYKTAALTWTYGGDLDVMKQFAVYRCDENGGNRTFVAAGRKFSQKVTVGKDAVEYFCVEAQDIYGGSTFSDVVSIQSVPVETEPPKAVILPKNLTGIVGSPVSFSGANSTDNDVIASYEWDFGDDTTGSGKLCTHTYGEAGSYKVQLTVTDESGNKNTRTETVYIYDITGEDATHAKLTVTVRDAFKSGSPVVANANVVVTTEDCTFETSGVTDSKGQISLVVPLGKVVVTVAANGFVPRSKDMTVESNETGSSVCEVGLTPMDVSVVDGSLTVREMTREEIEEAGIDMSAPENNQVFEFEVVLEFNIDMKSTETRTVTGISNSAGQVLSIGKGGGWSKADIDVDSGGGGTGGGESEPDLEDIEIGVFPVAEYAYLVIYGQSHWLKEMFHVELLVANNSYMYDMTDCVATLDLPEGMSLAAMNGEAQSETIEIGTVGKQGGSAPNTEKANWYVCGDDVGEYYLTAGVSGLLDQDPFSANFTTDSPVKVYAGEALHLYIRADAYAAKGLAYPVEFELKNVSAKDLYNVELEMLGAEFYALQESNIQEIHYKQGGESWQWKDGAVLSAQTLKPGESLIGQFQIRFAKDLAKDETRYLLTEGIAYTLPGSTTEVPVSIEYRDNIFLYNSNYKILDKLKYDETCVFAYDDDFFRQSAAIFNPDLAYMTMCLAAAGYNSAEVFRKGYSADVAGRNIRDLLTKIGFEENKIQQRSEGASYEGRPEDDSIAATFASRPFEDNGEDYTLLTVVVRGGNYAYEWHDNFIVGTAEEHEGFAKAATKVVTALNQYIKDQHITGKVKIWITGYSRGSATANLVAARIMDGQISPAVTCTKENLYAYGFATPMNTTSKRVHDSRYSTIYSIVSPADFVPMVAPEEWGFDRYGQTYYLPSPGVSGAYKDYEPLLKNAYAYITAHRYEMDGFSPITTIISKDKEEIEVSISQNNAKFMQEAFLQEFSQILFGQSIPSAELYTAKYQEAISDMIGTLLGSEAEWEEFGEDMKAVLISNIPILLAGFLSYVPQAKHAAIETLERNIAETIAEYSFRSPHMNLDMVTASTLVEKLEDILVDMLLLYPNYGLTMITNASYVGQAHYQEHYLAWMRAIQSESQYTEDIWEEILDEERGYRKIAIKCPVDVEVYDVTDGTPVLTAKFVDKQVEVVEGSSMVAYMGENGEMIVYLPYDGEYEIKVIATDDGEVTYTVDEVNLTTGEETKYAYYGVPVSEGDVLTAEANAVSEGQTAAYTLAGENGAVIAPSEVLDDDEIVNHTVHVTVEGEGVTMGGGVVEHGSFAKVTAYVSGNQQFVGWYKDDELVSEDAEYHICVREDLELVAKFAPKLTVSKFGWVDESGATPDGFNGTDPVQLTVELKNGSAAEATARVMVAYYGAGGKFLHAEVREIAVPAKGSAVEELVLSAERLQKAQSVKAFVLNEKQNPLCDSSKLEKK